MFAELYSPMHYCYEKYGNISVTLLLLCWSAPYLFWCSGQAPFTTIHDS